MDLDSSRCLIARHGSGLRIMEKPYGETGTLHDNMMIVVVVVEVMVTVR